MEYFECSYCGKCCSDGTINSPIVPLTLSDVKSLYELGRHTLENFVDSHIRWKLREDCFHNYSWLLTLATPCPYLNQDNRCDIYNEERPMACRTFPENLLISYPVNVPESVRECIKGKSLHPKRLEEIKTLEKKKLSLLVETYSYMGHVDIDEEIVPSVSSLVGEIPFITMLDVMLDVLDTDATRKLLTYKEKLDSKIIEFLQT